jgi:hypothetical protein
MASQPIIRNSGPADEAFLRAMTFPEEELRSLTSATWRGEFRWFTSRNVVPIEQARQRKSEEEAERIDL